MLPSPQHPIIHSLTQKKRSLISEQTFVLLCNSFWLNLNLQSYYGYDSDLKCSVKNGQEIKECGCGLFKPQLSSGKSYCRFRLQHRNNKKTEKEEVEILKRDVICF